MVIYTTTAGLPQPLTDDMAVVSATIGALEAGGQTAMGDGVALAHNELVGERARPGALALMIVLSDGQWSHGSDPLAAAEAAKAAGVRLITIGLGAAVDEEALTAMASGPGDYHAAPTSEELAAVYDEIAEGLCR